MRARDDHFGIKWFLPFVGSAVAILNGVLLFERRAVSVRFHDVQSSQEGPVLPGVTSDLTRREVLNWVGPQCADLLGSDTSTCPFRFRGRFRTYRFRNANSWHMAFVLSGVWSSRRPCGIGSGKQDTALVAAFAASTRAGFAAQLLPE
jgi:hypothetical protein